jgi:hypothetical protein
MQIVYSSQSQKTNCLIQGNSADNQKALVLILKTGKLRYLPITDLQMVGIVNNSLELREYL